MEKDPRDPESVSLHWFLQEERQWRQCYPPYPLPPSLKIHAQQRRGVVFGSIFVAGMMLILLAVGLLLFNAGRATGEQSPQRSWWTCIDSPNVLFRAYWSEEPVDPAVHAADMKEIARARRECGASDER